VTHTMVLAAKAVGSALVIAAGGLAGFAAARRVEAELREVERFENALLCLSSEISYALTPLPEALKRAGSAAGGEIGTLLARTGSLAGLSNRRSVSRALDLALAEVRPQSPKAVAILKELAANLGFSGHKEEVRYIEMSIDRTRSVRKELEGECRRKARLYRYLGLFSGASLAIVLL